MKRIVWIILSSIIVTIVFVGLKYLTFDSVMPNANYGMRAICKAKDIKDLYLGSSMFRQGIDAKEMGDSTYLLAYNSNRPFLEALQLKRLLDNGAKFDRLIVDMYPYSITRDVGISDVRMIMDGDIKFTCDVYRAMQKCGSPISTLYDLLFQQNNEIFLTLPVSYKLMNSRYHRGSNTSFRHGLSTEELAKLEPKEVDSRQMNEFQIKGLEQIISMCRDNAIELVFIETPKYQIINEDELYSKLMTDFAVFLSARDVEMILYDKTYDKVVDLINPVYVKKYSFDDSNPQYYLDLYHISYEGRQELSKKVLNLLNSQSNS